MTKVRLGTCYFPSELAAVKYYGTFREAKQKIAAGEIHIGKPEIKEGEKLILIDEGCRWAIEK